MVEASPFRHAEADDSPGFLLWKITALWQRTLARLLDGFGINHTQYAILASLRWFEESEAAVTQTHLAEHAKIEEMTLSKAIRRLEENGLVRRAQSVADGRATQVRFTPRGRKQANAAILAVEEADNVFFSAVSPTERAKFKATTVALIDANSTQSGD